MPTTPTHSGLSDGARLLNSMAVVGRFVPVQQPPRYELDDPQLPEKIVATKPKGERFLSPSEFLEALCFWMDRQGRSPPLAGRPGEPRPT